MSHVSSDDGAALAIAQRLAGIHWADLSPNLRDRVRELLVVNLSVALSGLPYVMLPVPPGAADGFPVLGRGFTGDGYDAALYNSAAVHARTQDDYSRSHSGGHIAACVIPAVLASGKADEVRGVDLLEAICVGYLAQIGLARVGAHDTMPRGFRSVGLYGVFGAAAALSRISGFDAAETANTLSLVASTASGIGQCWIDGSDEWQVQPGIAVCSALRARDLTRIGLRAAPHSLEGKAGFFKAYGGRSVTVDELVDAIDPDWVLRDVAFKRSPVSGICQPIVAACENLFARGVRGSDIVRLEIRLNPGEAGYPGTANRGPFRSMSDALMSAPFCAAVALDNGKLTMDDLVNRDRDLQRAETIAKVTMTADETCRGQQPVVVAELADGATQHGELPLTGGSEDRAAAPWLDDLWQETSAPHVPLSRLRAVVNDLAEAPNTADLIATITAAKRDAGAGGAASSAVG